MRRLQLLVLLLVCMLNVLAQNTSEFQQLMKKAKAGNAKAQGASFKSFRDWVWALMSVAAREKDFTFSS